MRFLMCKNDRGEWKVNREEIHKIILKFFGNIFQRD